MVIKKSNVSGEIFKYPYNANIDRFEKEMFSEKLCVFIIKIRKKGFQKAKIYLLSSQLILSIGTGMVPSNAMFPSQPVPIIRLVPKYGIGMFGIGHIKKFPSLFTSDEYLSKKVVIAQVIAEMPDPILFTKSFTGRDMEELYDISIEYSKNFISEEELIRKVTNLRGGNLDAVMRAAFITALILLIANNSSEAFQQQVLQTARRIIEQHRLNQDRASIHVFGQGTHFGYGKSTSNINFGQGGPRSITVTGLTQSAGSEKKEPSYNSWEYREIMRKLDKQKNKRNITILAGKETYTLRSTIGCDARELEEMLANQIYDGIRESDTDICTIASNVGYKADNIKKIKDHVFYNQHLLDQYVIRYQPKRKSLIQIFPKL